MDHEMRVTGNLDEQGAVESPPLWVIQVAVAVAREIASWCLEGVGGGEERKGKL